MPATPCRRGARARRPHRASTLAMPRHVLPFETRRIERGERVADEVGVAISQFSPSAEALRQLPHLRRTLDRQLTVAPALGLPCPNHRARDTAAGQVRRPSARASVTRPPPRPPPPPSPTLDVRSRLRHPSRHLTGFGSGEGSEGSSGFLGRASSAGVCRIDSVSFRNVGRNSPARSRATIPTTIQ